MSNLNFTIEASDGTKIDCKFAVVKTKTRHVVDIDLVNRHIVIFVTEEQLKVYQNRWYWDDLKAFCQKHADRYQYIMSTKHDECQAFTPGNKIQLLGKEVTLVADDNFFFPLYSEDNNAIYAPTKNFSKAVEDEIKGIARSKLARLCNSYTPILTDILNREWLTDHFANPQVRRYHKLDGRGGEVKFDNLQFLREGTKSFWGDCSVGGKNGRRVRFNWRIVSGHKSNLQYIAAHEMSHLLEMNHSAKFYRVVSELLGRDGKQADKDFDLHARGLHDGSNRKWTKFGSPNNFYYNFTKTGVDVDYI